MHRSIGRGDLWSDLAVLYVRVIVHIYQNGKFYYMKIVHQLGGKEHRKGQCMQRREQK